MPSEKWYGSPFIKFKDLLTISCFLQALHWILACYFWVFFVEVLGGIYINICLSINELNYITKDVLKNSYTVTFQIEGQIFIYFITYFYWIFLSINYNQRPTKNILNYFIINRTKWPTE